MTAEAASWEGARVLSVAELLPDLPLHRLSLNLAALDPPARKTPPTWIPDSGGPTNHDDTVLSTHGRHDGDWAGIRHFVYLSVAHPAPMMHAYIAVRSACEAAIESARLNATILRPWYVLGPGHWWPYLLVPFYKIAERLPATRDGAQRLGLVTLEQMRNALTVAVENPAQGTRLVSVPEIRSACVKSRANHGISS